jgi:site-specific recombinase XerD
MTPLRQRMLEDMQIRNFSENTRQSYLQQVSLFARHFRRSPEGLGPENIRTYQVYLTNEKKLAAGSILIATSALRFLYTVTLKRPWDVEDVLPMPKKSQTLPIILSPAEVRQFLSCAPQRKLHTVLTVCYAAGLRISEAIALKPTDIDSQRMTIRVTQGARTIVTLHAKRSWTDLHAALLSTRSAQGSAESQRLSAVATGRAVTQPLAANKCGGSTHAQYIALGGSGTRQEQFPPLTGRRGTREHRHWPPPIKQGCMGP